MAAVRKIAFTDRGLQALKPAPAGKRYVVWDAAQTSLAIRVTDKGTRTFYFVRRLPGRATPIWQPLGRYPDLSLAEAREKGRESLSLATEGHDPREAKAEKNREAEKAAKAADASLFGVLAEQFIRQYEKRGLRRGAEVVARIRRELVPVWGKRPVTGINDSDLIELIEAVADRSGPFAARHLFSTLTNLFGWVSRRRKIPDPTLWIKRKDVGGLNQIALARDRVLSDDELRLVWQAAEEMTYPFGPLIKLLS